MHPDHPAFVANDAWFHSADAYLTYESVVP